MIVKATLTLYDDQLDFEDDEDTEAPVGCLTPSTTLSQPAM